MKSTKRADKRRSIEEAVLDLATEMIKDGGPEGVTMANLAQLVNLSVGGLYRYFPSKGAILVGLEKRSIASYHAVQEGLLEELEPKLARRPKPVAALARLICASAAYLEHARREPVQHLMISQMLASPQVLLDDDEAREVESHVRPVIERGAALMVDAVMVGALEAGDIAQRTFVMWAAMQGADQFRKRDRLLPPTLHSWALADHACDSLLRGWGARPLELTAARRLVPPLSLSAS
jgi:AcrR family transcriptional regulator